MVVVPVNADVNETESVNQEDGKDRAEGGQAGSAWRMHFQHHDGDDDGEDPVAEGFQAAFIHAAYLEWRRRSSAPPIVRERIVKSLRSLKAIEVQAAEA